MTFEMDLVDGVLTPDARAHNLLVGRDVEIDETASIGANVILYDGVRVGAGATIKHNCVIGEAPALAADSNAMEFDAAVTTIAERATICNGAIVLAGTSIGQRAIIGDQCFLREGVTIAEDCVIGRGNSVGAGAIVGARTKMQANGGLLPGMLIEEDVRIGGQFIGTTDDSFGRDPAAARNRVIVRRGARIGSAVCLMAGVEIGADALVGAGAVVRKSVPARTKVAGVPARVIGTVDDGL